VACVIGGGFALGEGHWWGGLLVPPGLVGVWTFLRILLGGDERD
jgi:hypothetical protein